MSLEVTPVQSNNGITSNDVAITAGAAAVGALGGGAMYFKTPAEDAFVKSGLKLENKALADQAETLAAALKQANGLEAGKELAAETKTALTKLGVNNQSVDGIKGKLQETIGKISDEKIFNKAKTAANDALAGTIDDAVKVADKTAAETPIKALYANAKENIKKEADKLDDAAKKGVEILKKAKMSAAMKWGGIAAATAAVLAAGYCFFTKGNDAGSEQPAQTEKA